MKRIFRHAFAVVIENYNHIRSVVGTAQAMDYSRSGQSNKVGCSSEAKSYPLTDFSIDVYNAVKHALTKEELIFFHTALEDKPLDLSVQDDNYLALQERLGRVFVGRKIYPLQLYFSMFKQQRKTK